MNKKQQQKKVKNDEKPCRWIRLYNCMCDCLMDSRLFIYFISGFSLGGGRVSFFNRGTFWIILVQHLNIVQKKVYLIMSYDFAIPFLTHSTGPGF